MLMSLIRSSAFENQSAYSAHGFLIWARLFCVGPSREKTFNLCQVNIEELRHNNLESFLRRVRYIDEIKRRARKEMR